MKALVLVALLLAGCGGGAGGGGPAGESSTSAVGPVADRPTTPVVVLGCDSLAAGTLPDGGAGTLLPGVACDEVTAGVANVCNAVPVAGYLGCCCQKNGAAVGSGEQIIPGGPADVCTMPHAIGDSPHPNCIEAPNLTTSPCGAGGSYEQGYQSGYVNGVDVGYGTGTGACCCY